MLHRGYFGLMQHAYLAGYAAAAEEARKNSAGMAAGPFLPVDRMFFVSAFQGGIDHFLAPVQTDPSEGLEFLKSRVSAPKKRDVDVTLRVSRAFKEFRQGKRKDYENIHIVAFVADLICAMRNDASMLSVIPVPDPVELSRAFVPEMSVPLIQLVSSFQPYGETVPVPRTSISRDGLYRFQEIIESGAFQRYSRQHLALQDEHSNIPTVLTRIQKSGKGLLGKGKRLLVPQPSLIHILKVVPKMVDTIFGKLPGLMAQLAGDAAQQHVNEKKRVVVYHYDKWISAYTAMQMGGGLARSRSVEGRKGRVKRAARKLAGKGANRS